MNHSIPKPQSGIRLFLLGLPGSGKTTIGKELSERLHLPFVDLDSEIEKTAGKKIKEIFSEQGEKAFRELESSELKKWCALKAGFIMATGGGAPCFFDNMESINTSGTSIFLDVSVDEIVRRMERTLLSERPLLGKVPEGGLRDKIEAMRSARIGFYRQAKITMRGESLTAAEIIAKLGR